MALIPPEVIEIDDPLCPRTDTAPAPAPARLSTRPKAAPQLAAGPASSPLAGL